MKKLIPWIFGISLLVFAIDWAVMGMKIFSGEYNITLEAYIGLVCVILLLVCALFKLFTYKCPHCGKLRLVNGKYCAYCGKRIEIK